MKTDEIREKYLDFFVSKGHARRPSDVLTPTWDPSVLFTPAGMNQFKPHFLGKVKLDFTRATTSQKCLRTGDIENVGRTSYHHTFFEMLGNFSFGDYFKRDAINWAWELLTDKKWFGIDPDKLTVTVYQDDEEAADIWRKDIGLTNDRITPYGESDNFWPASAPSEGPDGVCGPCSEIFFRDAKGEDVEIWNLVFTQFNRIGDPPDNLHPLPSKNIDTGMGLERIASVMQGVDTNYHIDILRPLVEAAAEVTGRKYDPSSEEGRRMRRIADHVRAATMAIHENVYPGPNKEKYVIRRLLRKAVLDGRQMGMTDPFLYQLPAVVAEMMKHPYPELGDTVERVSQVIKQEESAFFSTIDQGLGRVEKAFAELNAQGRTTIDGELSGPLYETYGFPPELFESLAQEKGFAFDWDSFREYMDGLGGSGASMELFKSGPVESLKNSLRETEFLGYETTTEKVEIKGVVARLEGDESDSLCHELAAEKVAKTLAQKVVLILDRTPFYGESGGQVGDQGEITGDNFRFVVHDTQKDDDLILHIGELVSGKISEGDAATATVDTSRRDAIRRAHSATHILHHSLQQSLGEHAQQQGSKVDNDFLRFDFTNLEAIPGDVLASIEQQVIEKVDAAEPISWKVVPLEEAKKAGAMMLFGEKYPDPVRMVSMGEFSKELCGGTHLTNTDQVVAFEIVNEESVSAGIRRIEALTGDRAREHADATTKALAELAEKLGVSESAVPTAIRGLMQKVRELKKQLAGGGLATQSDETPPKPKQTDVEPDYPRIKSLLSESARLLNVGLFKTAERVDALQKEISQLGEQIDRLTESGNISADTLLEGAEQIDGVTLIVTDTPGANSNLMRQWVDQIRKKQSPAAIFLAAAQGDSKALLVAAVTRDLVDKGVSAGDWVKAVAPVVGGGGGGKPDLAQAGGKEPAKIPDALAKATEVIKELLAK